MKPNQQTKFLPLSEIGKYTDKDKYFCMSLVFSPDTENDHFKGCPPYIEIIENKGDKSIFFEVPEIVAYYAKMHPGYTMQGLQNREREGARKLANKIKSLL